MAEQKVLQLMTQHNKPFNVQGLADFLATQGVKKTQVQKALDTLLESGKILMKEFGKTKIYMPPQSSLPVLSKEEADAKRAQIKELQDQVQQASAATRALEQELKEWENSMSEEQMLAMIQQLQAKSEQQEVKLAKLRDGSVLVTAEERASAQKALSIMVDHWRKRKGIFRTIWDAVSESMDGKEADLFEEMGVDTDEAAGITLKDIEQLLPGRGAMAGRKRLAGQM